MPPKAAFKPDETPDESSLTSTQAADQYPEVVTQATSETALLTNEAIGEALRSYLGTPEMQQRIFAPHPLPLDFEPPLD